MNLETSKRLSKEQIPNTMCSSHANAQHHTKAAEKTMSLELELSTADVTLARPKPLLGV